MYKFGCFNLKKMKAVYHKVSFKKIDYRMMLFTVDRRYIACMVHGEFLELLSASY